MKLNLWENDAPLYQQELGQRDPNLTLYIPEHKEPIGAVIVCPGGAYCCLADHEGEPVARMLNEAGIAAFVLRYRIAPYRHPAMQMDVNRAVRQVRYHAAEWNIKPDKIGVLGFSAGGHLAVTAIEHFDYGQNDGDEIDRVSCRPDAGILCYPVVSMEKEYTHMGSREYLLGKEPSEELAHEMSGECSVRDDTPPTFIWHTAEDDCVPVMNSLMLAKALSEKKIPFELHVFPYGGHGMGLAQGHHAGQWAPLLVNWLKLNEF